MLERNARWAVAQPMPGLGDTSTPIEEVLEMYDKVSPINRTRKRALRKEKSSVKQQKSSMK